MSNSFFKFKFKNFKELGPLMAIGWLFPTSIAIGVLIGYYIDKIFNTAPVALILFFIFGTIAAFVNVYREYMNWIKKEKK